MLLLLLALETGVFLLFIPWSALWDRDFLFGALAPLHSFLRNHYVRGAISGLGVINVWVALAEASALLRARRPAKPAGPRESLPA